MERQYRLMLLQTTELRDWGTRMVWKSLLAVLDLGITKAPVTY